MNDNDALPIIMVGGNIEDWGIIPTFLDPRDKRPAAEQIHQHYIGGWNPFPGFTFDRATATLSYKGDPPLSPKSSILFGHEILILYPHDWVLILQDDGSWQIARLD